MTKICLTVLIGSVAVAFAGEIVKPESKPVRTPTTATNASFAISPIGRIDRVDGRTFVRLQDQYRQGLLGLEQWSHLWVFYWFDQNDTPAKRAVLQVHPRGNKANPLTGVFATRSPMRPNLLALSLCRVLSVKGTSIEIESIDAFDATPVIDLKPYAPALDSPQAEVKTPRWEGR